MKLKVSVFAYACGLVWGGGIFLLTWWSILLNGPTYDPTFIGRHLYPGFSMSPLGSLFGLSWGLVDGAVAGAILAWLYNKMVDYRGARI